MQAVKARSLRQPMTQVQSLQLLREKIEEGIERNSSPDYVPTGLQEDIIYWVGSGKYQIVLALHPNDVGKTTAGANILKNIIWQHDPVYFGFWDGFSLYRDKSWELKTFRIASNPRHLMENSAIHTEIRRWWPKGRYEWTKGGQEFPSQCTCDNGWTGDALSYNQSSDAFESKKLSLMWWDEPGKPDLIGASTSRFAADGMLFLITATPVKAGAFLDIIDDIADRGVRVKKLTGTADENNINSGKPNHLGTKRGLRTDEQIQQKKDSCPLDEYDARILGKANYKSGRIYYDFNRNYHVQDFDLSSKYMQTANCFTAMDPHDKAYPFIQMWALTEDGVFIQYNEWPTYEELGNNFYDEMRKSLICNYDIETLAKIIKIYEGGHYGLHTIARWMDPRFGKSSRGTVGDPESLMAKYARYNIQFSIPKCEAIEVQRDRIRSLWKRDTSDPMSKPGAFIMPHCVNSIRMMERHYWEDEKDCESEQYKEGPDCTRIFFAGLRETKYRPVEQVSDKKKVAIVDNPIITEMKKMAGISLA